eukprot:CAMPEP_0169355190 /NCGR_PEP_ID=MMETSP1017-20121227/26841_1 /TAXON_ID=342587 /ORGANISM="Karlodinium micrum, Strain CCMP2283" /LENGTH=259 /DNA_ID=CAMNT_0009451823 /DNA_START=64 /DNA_END=840 /DNA_ORIENTATION=-
MVWCAQPSSCCCLKGAELNVVPSDLKTSTSSGDYSLPVHTKLDKMFMGEPSRYENEVSPDSVPPLYNATHSRARLRTQSNLSEKLSENDEEKRTVNGAWLENAHAKQYCHIIEESFLNFGYNVPAVKLEISASGTSFYMQLAGAEFLAVLDQDGNSLCWSDGGVWARAGLDGTWHDEKTGQAYVIQGASMFMPDAETDGLQSLDVSGFTTCTVHGDPFAGKPAKQAVMAPSGRALNWSSGETWTRRTGLLRSRNLRAPS